MPYPRLRGKKPQSLGGWSEWPLALKLWVTFTTLMLTLSLFLCLIISPPKALLYLLAVVPVGLLLLAFYLLDYRHTLPTIVAFECFWLGAAISAPVAVGLEIFFIWLTPIPAAGTPNAPPLGLHVFYSLLRCFLSIAFIEELCKLVFIVRIRPATPENPPVSDTDLNPDTLALERYIAHPYGVVVASICTAAGFAAVENITYVVFAKRLMLGVETAILRAFVSVPGHMAFSALATSFIAEYKFHPQLKAKGSVRPEPHPGWLLTFFGLGAATMIHGVFDWVLSCVEILKKHHISSATFLTVLSGMITLALIGLTLLLFVLLSRPLRLYSEMPFVKSYRISMMDEAADLKPVLKVPDLSRAHSSEPASRRGSDAQMNVSYKVADQDPEPDSKPVIDPYAESSGVTALPSPQGPSNDTIVLHIDSDIQDDDEDDEKDNDAGELLASALAGAADEPSTQSLKAKSPKHSNGSAQSGNKRNGRRR